MTFAEFERKQKLAWQRAWYAKNRKYAIAYAKKWAKANRERINAVRREYYAKNPEVRKRFIAASSRQMVKQRLKPEIKIKGNLSRHLNRAVQKRNTIKSVRTFQLIGCSTKQLMRHLESQFQEGMAWNNYGKVWHVDHIKPIASFDILQLSEQRKCFHWSNLRPLWAIENIRKGAKLQSSN